MPFNVDPGIQAAPKYRIDPVKGDMSGAVLAEGVGNILDTAVSAVDNSIKEDISSTIRKEYDLDNTIFGVKGASVMESPTGAAEKLGTDTPEGIKQAQQQLQTAKDAVQQGKLRESNYQSRLVAVMRQLRAQYPGYVDDIDKIATQITGQNPEHAARKALMAEWEHDATTARQEETRRQNNIDQWAKEGVLPPNWQSYPTYEELRNDVYKRQAMDADIKRKQSSLELADKENKAKQQDAIDLAWQYSRNTQALQFNDTLRNMGIGSWDDLFKKIQEYKSDGVVSPEELQQIDQVFDQLQRSSDDAFNKFIQQPLGDGPNARSIESIIQNKDKIEEIRSSAQRELDQMKSNFRDGKTGLLSINKVQYDSMMEGNALEMGKKNPVLLQMNALQKLGGNPAVESWIRLNPDVLTKLDTKSKSALFSTQLDSATKGTAIKDNLKALDNETGIDPSVKGSYVKSLASLLQDKDASPELIRNVSRALYGSGNLDFMATANLSDKDKETTFRFLTSPEMSSFMFKNKAVDPEGWNNYRRWVAVSSQGLYQQAASTLQSYIVDKSTPFTINFDGSKFVISNANPNIERTPTVDPMTGIPTGGYTTYTEKPPADLSQAVEKLNIGLANAAEVAKLNGEQPDVVYRAFTNNLRIDTSAKKNPTFWDTVRGQIQKLWSTDTPDSNAKRGARKLGSAPGNPNGAAGAIARMAAPVASAIRFAASNQGQDVNMLSAFAFAESGGDPSPASDTGSYKGLFQMSQGDFNKWKQTPDADIYNPRDNALAFAAKIKFESSEFKKNYGRVAEPVDIYLQHQQGVAGYKAHVENPNGTAWENVRKFYDSDQQAKNAIWGNITPEMKANYPGGVTQVTSEDFTTMWKNRLEEITGESEGFSVNYGSADRKAIQKNVTSALDTAQANLPFQIVLSSGARDEVSNARAGGTPGSEHLTGNAVDISLKGLTNDQRTQLVASLVQAGFNRIGAYSGNTGLHVDMKGQRKKDGSPWAMFDRTSDNMDQAPKWFRDGLELGRSSKVDIAKKGGGGEHGIMGLDIKDLIGGELSLNAVPGPGDAVKSGRTFKERVMKVGRESRNIEDIRGLKEAHLTLEELLEEYQKNSPRPIPNTTDED